MLARALQATVRQPATPDLCLEFTASSSQSILLPALGSLSDGDSSFSYWVDQSGGGSEYIFDAQTGRRLFGDSGSNYATYGGGWNTSDIAVLTGWHHIVWVESGGAWRQYIDDTGYYDYVGTGSSSTAYNGSVALASRYSQDSNFLDGKLGDVRIYDGAITTDEIAALYINYNKPVTTTATLMAWYKLDEGPANSTALGSGSIIDSSGNALHGTASNSPVYRTVA